MGVSSMTSGREGMRPLKDWPKKRGDKLLRRPTVRKAAAACEGGAAGPPAGRKGRAMTPSANMAAMNAGGALLGHGSRSPDTGTKLADTPCLRRTMDVRGEAAGLPHTVHACDAARGARNGGQERCSPCDSTRTTPATRSRSAIGAARRPTLGIRAGRRQGDVVVPMG